MAKNPLITDEVKRVIAEISRKHPDWRAKEIQDGVEKQLHAKPNSRFKAGWPGLSAVQKELTKQRKTNDARPPESKELDKPWNLYTLSRYELPPDAVPIVLFIRDHKYFDIERPLTIREAMWIARLYTLLPEYERNEEYALCELELWAEEYALMDELTELSGRPTPPDRFQSVEDFVLRQSETIRKYGRDTNALLKTKFKDDLMKEHPGIDKRELYFLALAETIERRMFKPLHPNTRFVDKEFEAEYIREVAQKYGADPVKLQDLKGKSVGEIEEAAKSVKYQKEAQNER